jgi:hypothetical protein
MPALPNGSLKQIASSLNFAHGTGTSSYFTPQNVIAPTVGDYSSLVIVYNGAGVAAGASTSVQGLLGGLASLKIFDSNNIQRYRFLGPQLSAWHYLMLRKTNPSPAVAAAAAGAIASVSWLAKLPVRLSTASGPWTFEANAGPLSEISTDLTSWTSNLTIYGQRGPVMGNEYIDYVPLPASLAAISNDLSQTLPLGVMYSDLTFQLNADSDFNYFSLEASGAPVYSQAPVGLFTSTAFDNSPATEPSTDVRPSGLLPIPFRPYARTNADTLTLNLNAVNAGADPHTGVTVGSAYNPYAFLVRRLA